MVIGTVWTAPWSIDITSGLKKGNNILQVEVANLWGNRLIGDSKLLYDGPKDDKWTDWLVNGKPRPSKRFTFTTSNQYNSNSLLDKSGLVGPVFITSKRTIYSNHK